MDALSGLLLETARLSHRGGLVRPWRGAHLDNMPLGLANMPTTLHGSCQCGACGFDVLATPKVRFLCHCTVCQSFTGRPFSDVTVVRAKDVTLVNEGGMSFAKHRPPPNINRGVCRVCLKPIVEYAGFEPLKMMFIPAGNFEDQEMLPEPQMHIFYHRRLADHQDDLPKYSGYLPSQLAAVRLIVRGL